MLLKVLLLQKGHVAEQQPSYALWFGSSRISSSLRIPYVVFLFPFFIYLFLLSFLTMLEARMRISMLISMFNFMNNIKDNIDIKNILKITHICLKTHNIEKEILKNTKLIDITTSKLIFSNKIYILHSNISM